MSEASGATMGTYLYGIARGLRPGPPALPSVGDADAKIRTIESAGRVAVVSDLADAFVDATAEDLQRHSDVLQKLLTSSDALVPLRFGTVYPDDESVARDLLEARGGELDALLKCVENRVEARLKAFYREESVLAEIVAEQPRIAELHRRTQALPANATYYDRIRLGELVAAALSDKRRRDGDQILLHLAPFAVDHCVEEEPHEWSVLTASFLLEGSAVEEFHSAVKTLADDTEQRVQVRCLAPLPPYSFVALPLEQVEAEAAWAS